MKKELLRELVQVARGQQPAELVIKNVQVLHSVTGEFISGDIAVSHGRIAGIGSYSGQREIDGAGRYAVPGFIDSHVHIESSMLSPAEYARAVVPQGTTAVIADPHEITNVAGASGLDYMLQAAKKLPLDVFFMLPSCVPATSLEDSGASLTADELAPLIEDKFCIGLAEMMNYPGVIMGDSMVYDKLALCEQALVDGHAPGVLGRDLQAYAAAGIRTDHECSTVEEGRARLEAGMYLQIREGSAAKNMEALLPLVNRYTAPFCLWAVDDCHPSDLIADGDMNRIISKAVRLGLDVPTAINMATVNVARCYGLRHRGQLAPHYHADILLLDNLVDFRPSLVIKDGVVAAENGRLLVSVETLHNRALENSMQLAPVSEADLAVPCKSGRAKVIGIIPNQLVSRKLVEDVKTENGFAVADTERDILKLAVLERHHATGRNAVGLVKGYGLKRGAIASTVAHDSHNLIVVGTNDDDMLLAIKTLQEVKGGLTVVDGGKVIGVLPLPIGGLMTDEDAKSTAEKMEQLIKAARDLGVSKDCDPFLTMGFLSLPVIPELKLTNRGLVDVTKFSIVPVECVVEDVFFRKKHTDKL